MEVTAILLETFEIKQINDNFTTMDFVATVDHNSQYPQYVTFQVHNAKIIELEKIPLGVEVKINFTLKGKKYINQQQETKYFNILHCFGIVQTYQKG